MDDEYVINEMHITLSNDSYTQNYLNFGQAVNYEK